MDSVQQKAFYAAGLTLAIVAIGALVYRSIENWSWLDSIYFSVSTLATVGFGDLHPTHSASRVFTILFMLIGIPIMFYTITLLGIYSIEKRAYTKPFGLFRKAKLESIKRGKAKKLVREIENLNEKMNVKMKELEVEEEKKEKQIKIKRNTFNS